MDVSVQPPHPRSYWKLLSWFDRLSLTLAAFRRGYESLQALQEEGWHTCPLHSRCCQLSDPLLMGHPSLGLSMRCGYEAAQASRVKGFGIFTSPLHLRGICSIISFFKRAVLCVGSPLERDTELQKPPEWRVWGFCPSSPVVMPVGNLSGPSNVSRHCLRTQNWTRDHHHTQVQFQDWDCGFDIHKHS